MLVGIKIPNNEIPTKQDIISVAIHFMDGKIVECDYPFIELEQDPCEDCISRQAVLDLPRIKTHNVWGIVIHESVDVKDITQLPSVNPAGKTGH